jgi:hypothetical protein
MHGQTYIKVSVNLRDIFANWDYFCKILRKIYGPVKGSELWRIGQNNELEAIIKGENIVRFIKCQRIQWLGHVERMQDTKIPKKMLY